MLASPTLEASRGRNATGCWLCHWHRPKRPRRTVGSLPHLSAIPRLHRPLIRIPVWKNRCHPGAAPPRPRPGRGLSPTSGGAGGLYRPSSPHRKTDAWRTRPGAGPSPRPSQGFDRLWSRSNSSPCRYLAAHSRCARRWNRSPLDGMMCMQLRSQVVQVAWVQVLDRCRLAGCARPALLLCKGLRAGMRPLKKVSLSHQRSTTISSAS
jgi:hypothetical protein